MCLGTFLSCETSGSLLQTLLFISTQLDPHTPWEQCLARMLRATPGRVVLSIANTQQALIDSGRCADELLIFKAVIQSLVGYAGTMDGLASDSLRDTMLGLVANKHPHVSDFEASAIATVVRLLDAFPAYNDILRSGVFPRVNHTILSSPQHEADPILRSDFSAILTNHGLCLAKALSGRCRLRSNTLVMLL